MDETPTHLPLETLPLRARAAFALRCAQRLASLTPQDFDELREGLINVADLVNSVGGSAAADLRFYTASFGGCEHTPLSTAARAAANAALASVGELEPVDEAYSRGEYSEWPGPDPKSALWFAEQSVGEAERAMREWPWALNAVLSDFETLRRRASTEQWVDDQPVPLSVFGPMWPEWCSSDEGTDPPLLNSIQVELEVPDSLCDEELADLVGQFLAATDDYHRAIGGSGLTVLPPIEIDSPVRTEANS